MEISEPDLFSLQILCLEPCPIYQEKERIIMTLHRLPTSQCYHSERQASITINF